MIGFKIWYDIGRFETARKDLLDRIEAVQEDDKKHAERMRVALEDSKQKAQSLQDQLAIVESEMRAESLRKRIYLLARLHDYSRELSFWRDTIRKLLTSSGSVLSPDKVIEQVTASLRTFGTLDRKTLDDFEAIKVGAELLNGGKRNEQA
jgi:hypothetical protein